MIYASILFFMTLTFFSIENQTAENFGLIGDEGSLVEIVQKDKNSNVYYIVNNGLETLHVSIETRNKKIDYELIPLDSISTYIEDDWTDIKIYDNQGNILMDTNSSLLKEN